MNKNLLSAFTIGIIMMMGASAHAAFQSQTLIRLVNDGLIQTLPATTIDNFKIYMPGIKDPKIVSSAAFLYDQRNPLPPMLSMGGNYAFFANDATARDQVMVTVSENGTLNYKGKVTMQPSTLEQGGTLGLGGNYFINKGTSEIIAIDSAGFFNFTGKFANNIRLLGGNFIIDQDGNLTTIKHMGTAPGNPLGMVTVKEGWCFSDAIRAGGNYFIKLDGSIVGINSENGFFTDPQKIDSMPAQLGGNYFVTQDKVQDKILYTLYTVSSNGEVKKQMPIVGKMKYFGYSYLIDEDGDFIFIDGNGTPHTELVRVSTTGIKSEVVNKIKDLVNVPQTFIPSEQ